MKLRIVGEPRIGVFFCPGCQEDHSIPLRPADRPPSWEYRGTQDAPTLSPSILRTWKSGDPENHPDRICHSFVTDGRIQFLGDCTHNLAGQTVVLPEIPESINGQ